MRLTRRDFLRLSAIAGGAVMLDRHMISVARALGPTDAFGTARASRLFPGEMLVHTDLHNHSHLSDGAGDPAFFYERIRAAGLDVAALTDHATLSKPQSQADPDYDSHQCGPEPADGSDDDCHSLFGLDEEDWARAGVLADAADDPGRFTGLRGFEWSSPTVGHSNAWFTRTWVDPLATGGLDGDSTLAQIADASDDDPFGISPLVTAAAEDLIGQFERTAGRDGVAGWFNWLLRAPDAPDLGGGADGIFGFNHPGREPGRFADFRFEPALRDRLVSIEMFNKGEDFLFEGTDLGRVSPLVACLDNGWRPGIIGNSDEHDPDWGSALGKGKGGLWVRELSRRGIREALEARRFYAHREKGLRVDAAANGQRMGTSFGHVLGPIRFELDIAQFDVSRNTPLALEDGDASTPPVGEAGQHLVVQVLMSGTPVPTILHQREVTVPGPGQPVIEFQVPVDVTAGRWVVIRLCDPSRPAEIPEESPVADDSPYRSAGRAVAYTSPWYLDPDLPPPTVTHAPGNPPDDGGGGTGGGGTPVVPVRVTRLAGADRVATAVEVSRAGFATGTAGAWVATSQSFADALAGVPAAYLEQAPVLLTDPDELPDAVADELARLDPVRITLLGGPRAVSEHVEDQLREIAPTRRLAGEDRIATAVEVSRAAFPDGADEVGVATAVDFPDALAGGAGLARVPGPLLLTPPDALPDAVADEVRRLAPRRIVVLGGPRAVSDDVVATLDELAPEGAERDAGEDRYGTATEASTRRFDTVDEVLVATGERFPDAVSGGALAAQRGAPVLLVTRDTVPDATDAEIRRLRPQRITIVGGTEVIGPDVEAALGTYESG